MSFTSSSSEDTLGTLRAKLPDYLLDQGLDVSNSKKILCINPEHLDRSPSMSLFYPEPDVPVVHCFSCLTGSTLVKTDAGFVKAKDIRQGDIVLTHKNRWQKINSVMQTKNKVCSLYSFQTYFYRVPTVLTQDHPILVVTMSDDSDYNSLDEKPIGKVNIEKDYVAYPCPSDLVVHNVYRFKKEGSTKTFNCENMLALTPVFSRLAAMVILDQGFKASGYTELCFCLDTDVVSDEPSGRIVELGYSVSHLERLIQMVRQDVSPQDEINASYFHDGTSLKLRVGSGILREILTSFSQDYEEDPYQFIKIISRTSNISRCAFVQTLLSQFNQFSFSHKSLGIIDTIFGMSLGMIGHPVVQQSSVGEACYKITLEEYDDPECPSYRYALIKGVYYLLCPIVLNSISNNPKNAIVYDFEVNVDHTFQVASCLIHNCQASYDIFSAAHVLENKPRVGPAFIHDNAKYLADKFGIELKVKQLTDEQVYELNTYQAYQLASDYILKTTLSDLAQAELDYRQWDPKKIKRLGVGYCDSYDSFRAMMKGSGFSARFLDDIDLSNRQIFSPNNLIFCIKDDVGRPVGFAARNLRYDGIKGEDNKYINGSKFVNTKTTGVKCNIYRKSERLFLLDLAKRKSSSLIIMEGYGDAVTAHLAGIKNAVAIGSLQLTSQHLNSCRSNGIYDVTICLDADLYGQKKAKEILDDILQNVHDIKIRFIFLDQSAGEDGSPSKMDPDMFIRTKGAEAFNCLSRVNPFSWRLMEFLNDDSVDPEIICFNMIPIIISEPSPIKRERMSKELSDHTGYTTKAIREEIDKIVNSEALRIYKMKDAIVDDVKASLAGKNDSAELVLQRGLDSLSKVDKETNRGSLQVESLLSNMLAIKDYQEQESLHSALNFGDNFSTLSVSLSGDVRGKMIVMGGVGNVGKCLKYDALVQLSDGRRVPIEEVVKKKIRNVVTMKNNLIIPAVAYGWIDSGVLPCYRVTTKSGFVIEPSETHPFYTPEGWKPISSMIEGDYIGVARSMSIPYGVSLETDELDAQVLSLCFCYGGDLTKVVQDFSFSKRPGELLCNPLFDRFKSLMMLFDGSSVFLESSGSCTVFNPCPHLLSMRNEILEISPSREGVLEYAMSRSVDFISTFVSSLFLELEGLSLLRLTTTSIVFGDFPLKTLASLKSLLLVVGLHTRVQYDTLRIYDRHFKEVFDSIVPDIFNRDKHGSGRWAMQFSEDHSISIPRDYALVRPARLLPYETERSDTISYSRASALLSNYSSRLKRQMKAFMSLDVMFESIKRIEKIGDHQCYDLSIRGTHNFVADGVLVHNTSQFCNMAWNLSERNDDVISVIYTIDDSDKELIPRLVTYDMAMRNIKKNPALFELININKVATPFLFKENMEYDAVMAEREISYQKLFSLVSNERLCVIDSSHGSSIDVVNNAVKHFSSRYPEKRVIIFVDECCPL